MDSISSSSQGSLSTGPPSVSSFSSGECGYSIVMVSIGSLSTGSSSLSTFSSGECSNAILYSGYISSEFNFVLFVLILFERIYSERKFNVGVTASSGHVV